MTLTALDLVDLCMLYVRLQAAILPHRACLCAGGQFLSCLAATCVTKAGQQPAAVKTSLRRHMSGQRDAHWDVRVTKFSRTARAKLGNRANRGHLQCTQDHCPSSQLPPSAAERRQLAMNYESFLVHKLSDLHGSSRPAPTTSSHHWVTISAWRPSAVPHLLQPTYFTAWRFSISTPRNTALWPPPLALKKMLCIFSAGRGLQAPLPPHAAAASMAITRCATVCTGLRAQSDCTCS